MGEKSDKGVEFVEIPSSGEKESRRNRSPGNSEAEKRGEGRGGRARGEQTDGKKESTDSVPQVASVDEKKEERNRKRRERYAEKKQAEGKEVKPRKLSNTKGKKKEADDTQINAFITAISTMVSSREGCGFWMLTPDETKSLSQPLANMLEKNEAFSQISEHSDAIALVIASMSIFVPRVIMANQLRKVKKDAKKNFVRNTERKNDEKRKDSDGVRDDAGEHPATSNVVNIATVSEEYGDAISY